MKTVGTFVASAAVAILSAAASVALALGILGAADAPYFAVASNSMAPQMQRGDLVVASRRSELHPGDVITFSMYGQVVTHRVVAAGRRPGTYETRGDANPGNDPWTVGQSDVIGTVHSVVTNAGWPLLWSGSAAGRLAVTVVLLCAVFALMWAWPRAIYAQAAP